MAVAAGKDTVRQVELQKILILLSVEVVDEAAKHRLRVKEESYKAYIKEELSLRKRRKEIHQAQPWWHWQQANGAGIGDLANTRGSRKKSGVFLGTAHVLLQEREATAEGDKCRVDHRGHFSCWVCCTALAFPFRS